MKINALPGNGVDLIEWIQGKADNLTPSEIRLAAHLNEHPEVWAFEPASHLAELLNMHRSTIVRFAQNLGFKGYPEIQAMVREGLLRSFSPAAQSLAGAEGEQCYPQIQQIFQRELSNLQRSYKSLDMELLNQTAELLAHSQKAVVFGRRFSFPIALHLGMSLQFIRGGVKVAPEPGGASIDALFDLTPQDTVLVVSMKRHSREVSRTLSFLHKKAVPFTLLTDTSPLVNLPENTRVLQANIGSASILASFTALTSISHILLSLVAQLTKSSPGRLEEIERAWHDFNN